MCAEEHTCDGGESAADPFADEEKIGNDSFGCAGVPLTSAPCAGDHLVGDEQHVQPVADAPQQREVAGWRHEHAAGCAHDRFDDDGRDRLRVLREDRGFELCSSAGRILLLCLALASVPGKRHGWGDGERVKQWAVVGASGGVA